MSLMSPKQIKRFQWVANLLRNPDSGVKPEEIPVLTKELEAFQARLVDEELYTNKESSHDSI